MLHVQWHKAYANACPHCEQAVSRAATTTAQFGQLNMNLVPHAGHFAVSSLTTDPQVGHSDWPHSPQMSPP